MSKKLRTGRRRRRTTKTKTKKKKRRKKGVVRAMARCPKYINKGFNNPTLRTYARNDM